MIVRWLIRVCVALAAAATVARASLLDEVDAKLTSKRNITEKTGLACAYADFNQDRATDVLHYHDKKLHVLLQQERDFAKEDHPDAQKYSIDLGEDYAEVACSVGDINGDGYHDIVASLRTKKGEGVWKIRYFTWNNGESRFVEGDAKVLPAKHQVALIDVTGDGVHDLIGIQADGSNLMCLAGDSNLTFQIPCDHLFLGPNDTFSGALHPLMPILFGDVDGDRYAELVLMKHEDGKGIKPEVWSRTSDQTGWETRPDRQFPALPAGVSFLHTLAPLLSDIDLNQQMNFIVPVCKDKTCTTIDSLQSTQWNNSRGTYDPWATITIDLGANTIVAEEDTLVRMKAGDATLDGYPDMLVTIGSVSGGNNYAAVLENQLSENGGARRFGKTSQMMIMPGLALGMIQSSSFFDFAEDGYLDVLVQWKLRDGDDWQWSLCISEPKEQGDVTFLKVQTFLPLPLDGKRNQVDIKLGLGVVYGGTCVTYEMETTGIGEKRRAIECQVPGNSHKAGLSPPFALFGLGRNPNFVDKVEIGVPRADTDSSTKYHIQTQIVPNARMMVSPPHSFGYKWMLRLYLTPSTLIYSSLIVMASTCTILLIVVLILHFREKKVDRVERAAQSHRFHFDAM